MPVSNSNPKPEEPKAPKHVFRVLHLNTSLTLEPKVSAQTTDFRGCTVCGVMFRVKFGVLDFECSEPSGWFRVWVCGLWAVGCLLRGRGDRGCELESALPP